MCSRIGRRPRPASISQCAFAAALSLVLTSSACATAEVARDQRPPRDTSGTRAAAAVAPAAAPAAATPASDARAAAQNPRLDAAIDLYEKLEIDKAIEALNAALVEESLTTGEKACAHEHLALAHIAMGKAHYAEAKAAVESMVDLAPSYRPDPDHRHREFMRIFFEVLDTKGLLRERPDPGIQTTAILDFDNNSTHEREELDPLRGGFADMLITELSKVSKMRVVERERIQFILDELDLQQTKAFDPATAARIGKLVGAHSVLIGSFIKIKSGKMRLDTRLVKTETAEIIAAEEVTEKTEDFFKLTKDLAVAVAKDLAVKVGDEDRRRIETPENKSLDALLVYSQGLRHADRGEYREACAKFSEALKYNPNYARAQARLDALRPLAS